MKKSRQLYIHNNDKNPLLGMFKMYTCKEEMGLKKIRAIEMMMDLIINGWMDRTKPTQRLS